MSEATKFTALIIDDEPPARDIVFAYLKSFPQIEVVAQCSNGFEALKLIQELAPGILFLDVQMPKITGLELLEVLDTSPAVVFSTAYDQYAIKAFELSAVDYLLKPYSQERFNQAVEKVLTRLAGGLPSPESHLLSLREASDEMLNRVVVKSGSKIVVIPLEELLFIEAQEDYVMIHTTKGRYLKSQTMRFFEIHLPANRFVRVHRSFIVNVEQVERLEPYDKEYFMAVIAPDHKLKVSRAGYKKLKETLKF